MSVCCQICAMFAEIYMGYSYCAFVFKPLHFLYLGGFSFEGLYIFYFVKFGCVKFFMKVIESLIRFCGLLATKVSKLSNVLFCQIIQNPNEVER
jgi:hypothetical protein